jgi:hypothetical protein
MRENGYIDSFAPIALSFEVTYSASISYPVSDSDSDGSMKLSEPAHLTARCGLRLLMCGNVALRLCRDTLFDVVSLDETNPQGKEGRRKVIGECGPT